jgi:hypothetical protein
MPAAPDSVPSAEVMITFTTDKKTEERIFLTSVIEAV